MTTISAAYDNIRLIRRKIVIAEREVEDVPHLVCLALARLVNLAFCVEVSEMAKRVSDVRACATTALTVVWMIMSANLGMSFINVGVVVR